MTRDWCQMSSIFAKSSSSSGLLRSTPKISAPIAGASGLVRTYSERVPALARPDTCAVLILRSPLRLSSGINCESLSAAYTSTWHRRPTLSAFHGVIQGVTVGYVDQRAAAAECWQGGKPSPPGLGP